MHKGNTPPNQRTLFHFPFSIFDFLAIDTPRPMSYLLRVALMPPPQHYDAIVIGSGQGGTPLCQALANAGLRTALIEKIHVGGTCINEGCTPTKTMVATLQSSVIRFNHDGVSIC